VDLQERRQLDLAERMHAVRSKARPWRSIISLVIALAAAAIAVRWGAKLSYDQHPPAGVLVPATATAGDRLVTYVGAGAFCIFGIAAALGLSGKAGSVLQALVGQAHAGVVRYAVLLVSLFVVLIVTLQLFRVPIGQLLLGGTLVGVLVGIAAQQALGNLFAGLVLMFARPFRVGDQVRFRSGSLGGMIEGTIMDISITYVRLETADGPTLVPNSQALAAASVLVKSLEPPDS
jgi:small-conductance mechanosensitive channel